jgi:hypothetical protein
VREIRGFDSQASCESAGAAISRKSSSDSGKTGFGMSLGLTRVTYACIQGAK